MLIKGKAEEKKKKETSEQNLEQMTKSERASISSQVKWEE